jgi:hypothetical protein
LPSQLILALEDKVDVGSFTPAPEDSLLVICSSQVHTHDEILNDFFPLVLEQALVFQKLKNLFGQVVLHQLKRVKVALVQGGPFTLCGTNEGPRSPPVLLQKGPRPNTFADFELPCFSEQPSLLVLVRKLRPKPEFEPLQLELRIINIFQQLDRIRTCVPDRVFNFGCQILVNLAFNQGSNLFEHFSVPAVRPFHRLFAIESVHLYQ